MSTSRLALLCTVAILVGLAALAPTAAAAAQEKVYAAPELTTPPRVRSKSAAAALIESSVPSKLASVGGKVQLRFVVGTDGKVEPESVEVLAATASVLGEAAARAVLKIQFTPGMIDDKPVRTTVAFPITYAAR